MLVRVIIIVSALVSSFAMAKQLDNTQTYTVPANEQWEVVSFHRNYCKVCTADIVVKDGSMSINDTWVYGNFELSFNLTNKFIIDSGTSFILGDVLPNLEINVIK